MKKHKHDWSIYLVSEVIHHKTASHLEKITNFSVCECGAVCYVDPKRKNKVTLLEKPRFIGKTTFYKSLGAPR